MLSSISPIFSSVTSDSFTIGHVCAPETTHKTTTVAFSILKNHYLALALAGLLTAAAVFYFRQKKVEPISTIPTDPKERYIYFLENLFKGKQYEFLLPNFGNIPTSQRTSIGHLNRCDPVGDSLIKISFSEGSYLLLSDSPKYDAVTFWKKHYSRYTSFSDIKEIYEYIQWNASLKELVFTCGGVLHSLPALPSSIFKNKKSI